MGFGINHALNIVADMPAVLRACCRRFDRGAGIGIGERYLPVRSIGQCFVYGQQAFNLLSDAVISARQMCRPLGPRRAGFLPVNPVSLLDIAADLGFQMRKAAGDLALGEVPVPVVHRFEFTAIHRDNGPLKHTDPATQFYKLRAGLADGRTVLREKDPPDRFLILRTAAGNPRSSCDREPVDRSTTSIRHYDRPRIPTGG
jgi:hypothetical protein